MVHCCSRRDSGLPDFVVDCMTDDDDDNRLSKCVCSRHGGSFKRDPHGCISTVAFIFRYISENHIFDSCEVISSLYCVAQYNFRGIKETPSQPKRTIRPAPTTKMATGSPKGGYFTRDAVVSTIQESNEEISVGHQINFHPVLTFYNWNSAVDISRPRRGKWGTRISKWGQHKRHHHSRDWRKRSNLSKTNWTTWRK